MNDIATENIDKIVEMYRTGKPSAEIGRYYELAEQGTASMLRAFMKIGVISSEDTKERKRRMKEQTSKELEKRNKSIASDYENSISVENIKEKYGISQETIKNVLKKEGICLSRRWYSNLKYPVNLIFDIFGNIDFEISEDTEKGLNFSLDTLNEREKKALCEYYAKEKPFREIADAFGLCVERTRQIHNKALRKMRHPERSNYIKFGYEGYTEMTKKKEQELQDKLKDRGIGDIKIEELELSVRGYNCMKRAGINVISDIKNKEQLMRVRNLGRKTCDEILQKIIDVGYKIPEYESDVM